VASLDKLGAPSLSQSKAEKPLLNYSAVSLSSSSLLEDDDDDEDSSYYNPFSSPLSESDELLESELDEDELLESESLEDDDEEDEDDDDSSFSF